MDPKTRRALESAFYNYYENEKKADQSLADISSMGLTANYSGMTVCGSGSNHFEQMLAMHADKQLTALRWFRVADNTMIKYRDEYKYKIIECLYLKRMNVEATTRRLKIDRATLFRWKNEILITAEYWAQKYGVI